MHQRIAKLARILMLMFSTIHHDHLQKPTFVSIALSAFEKTGNYTIVDIAMRNVFKDGYGGYLTNGELEQIRAQVGYSQDAEILRLFDNPMSIDEFKAALRTVPFNAVTTAAETQMMELVFKLLLANRFEPGFADQFYVGLERLISGMGAQHYVLYQTDASLSIQKLIASSIIYHLETVKTITDTEKAKNLLKAFVLLTIGDNVIETYRTAAGELFRELFKAKQTTLKYAVLHIHPYIHSIHATMPELFTQMQLEFNKFYEGHNKMDNHEKNTTAKQREFEELVEETKKACDDPEHHVPKHVTADDLKELLDRIAGKVTNKNGHKSAEEAFLELFLHLAFKEADKAEVYPAIAETIKHLQWIGYRPEPTTGNENLKRRRSGSGDNTRPGKRFNHQHREDDNVMTE